MAFQKQHAEANELSQHELCDVVALTSNTDSTTIERCKKIGFKEVLNKPLSFESLKRIACLYHYKMSKEEYEEYLEFEEKLSSKVEIK